MHEYSDTHTHTLRSPRTLSKDCHLVLVSSKLGNILLNPLQSQDLVPETLVTRDIVPVQVKTTHDGQPVVDAHHHHVLVHEVLHAVHLSASTSADIASSMDPDHHREFSLWVQIRTINIQNETILSSFLRHSSSEHVDLDVGHVLDTLLDSIPLVNWFRSPKPQLSYWRFGKWNTIETGEYATICAVQELSFYFSRLELNQWGTSIWYFGFEHLPYHKYCENCHCDIQQHC